MKPWSRIVGFGITIRHLGWLDGCLYAFARAIAIASADRARLYKYYLVAQPVARKSWLPPHRGRSFEVRQIVGPNPQVRKFPRPDWAAPYRFKQGAVCFAALQEETFVGFLWLTLGPYQEDEVRCCYVPLPHGRSAWDFDVHVEPEYRNGVAFLKLWDEANRFLATREFQWSLSRISAFNSGSMLSHVRMGAERIGAIAFLCIGSWQLAVSTIPPYFHFSTRADSYPTYAVSSEHLRRGKVGG